MIGGLRTVAMRLGAVLGVAASTAFATAPGGSQEPSAARRHELHYGVHLPQERLLTRSLVLAEEALAEQDYLRAFELIDQVLTAEEDAWIDVDPPRSARAFARGLIASLPPAGRRAYALHADARAARELEAAYADAAPPGLLRLAARYPHTPTEEEVLWLLSQRAWDNGQFHSADALIERGVASGRDPVQGVNRKLQQAVSRVALGGALLDDQLGADPAVRWAKAFGDRASSAADAGVSPSNVHQTHPAGRHSVAWKAVFPSGLSRDGSVGLDPVNDAVRPTPIVAAGLVLSRTGENVIATSAYSGRRVWETPAPKSRRRPADRRRVGDLAGLGISADSERIYAVEPLPGSSQSDSASAGQHIWSGHRPRAWRPEPNQLSAYSLKDQGKLSWVLSGIQGPEAVSPISVLGAPLCFDGRLVALVDADQTAMLVEIDPQSGLLLWRQSLVGADRAPIRGSSDAWAGITPDAAEGVFVCPTRGGMVVAFDWVRQSLRWAYRFPVDDDSDDRSSSHDAMWRDCKAVVLADSVFACSPDSDLLHCIDLGSGEQRWVAECPSACYMTVTDAAVIVSGTQVVEGFDLDSGERLWRTKLPTGSILAGRPLELPGGVLHPLSGGRIAALDANSGAIVYDSSALIESPIALIAHGNGLLAAGRDYLVRYVSIGDGPSGSVAGDPPAERLRGATALTHAGDSERALIELRSLVDEDIHFSAARTAYLSLLVSASDAPMLPIDAELLDRIRRTSPSDSEAAVASAALAVRRQDRERLWAAVDDMHAEVLLPDRLIPIDESRYAATVDAVEGALIRIDPDRALSLDAASARHLQDLAACERWLEADHFRWRTESLLPRAIAENPPTEWGAYQVAAEVQPSRSGVLQRTGRGRDFSGLIRVEVAQIGPPDPRAPTEFVVASDGSRLMGMTDAGEIIASLDTSDASDAMQKAAREPTGKPWAWLAGRVLVVATKVDIACFDLLADQQAKHRLWTASGSLRSAMSRRGQSDGPPESWSRSWAGTSDVAVVSPSRVVVANNGRLLCFDLLSGDLRWDRAAEQADLLWGVGDHLWLLHRNGSATKLSVRDGAELKSATHPRMELMYTLPDRFVGVVRSSGVPHLVVCDAEGMEVLADLAIESKSYKFWCGADGKCGVVAAPGWIQTVDAVSGSVSGKKAFSNELRSIGSTRFVGGRLLALVPRPSESYGGETVDSLESGDPFSGWVYSFDPATGETNWPSPAEVSGLELLSRQAGKGVLAFGARVTSVDGRRMTRVLLLDAVAGTQLYRGELIGSTPLNGYHVRSDASFTSPTFQLELSGETLALRSLSVSRPPEPPPSAPLATAAGAGELDIWELGQELKRAIEHAAADDADADAEGPADD